MPPKKNPKYSIAFNVYLYATIPSVRKTADKLYSDIISNGNHLKRLKNTIKIIIVNLYVAHEIDYLLYVSYSRDKNSFSSMNRMGRFFLNYASFIETIDYLYSNQYIESVQGFHYIEGIGFRSRMKSTPKLNRLFKRYAGAGGSIFQRKPPIELRDANGNSIPLKKPVQNGHPGDTPKPPMMYSMARNVFRLNIFLQKFDIMLDVSPQKIKEYRFFQNVLTHYQRIFNEKFYLGGRFYGHWSQLIKKEDRQYILIDGLSTIERDFSAYHAHMLYYIQNQTPPPGDMYSIPNIPLWYRPLIKEAVMTFINAKDRTSGLRSVNEKRTKFIKSLQNPPLNNQAPTPTEILNGLVSVHPVLNQYLCSGYGVYLQRIDSDIAEEIMITLMNMGILCLCIHDSFIVQRKYDLLLQDVMQDVFISYFGNPCPIK